MKCHNYFNTKKIQSMKEGNTRECKRERHIIKYYNKMFYLFISVVLYISNMACNIRKKPNNNKNTKKIINVEVNEEIDGGIRAPVQNKLLFYAKNTRKKKRYL